jgi:aarF domain-containing kinase
MTLNVHDLVAALPAELDREDDPSAALRETVAALSTQSPPTGVLRRMWSLGTLQGKVALGFLAYWLRSGYASADERERLGNEARLKLALKLVGEMSYLRGIVMKVGQTLANYPNLVPAEFAEALASLNFQAPPMHYSLLAEQVRRELGAEPEDLFAEFDRTAFAAASLGQVHRARLHSGEAVAVKIQYPGIARTIQSDFRLMLALLTPMRLTAEWDSLRNMLANARDMMKLETDYRREARFLERGRAAFGEREGIVIPCVVAPLSTARVLTMQYVDGVHIDAYLQTKPTQAQRDRYGELIMRASFRLAHQARLWYADSNPGNYLFMPDGRLGLIDFGCCCEFNADEWSYYKDMYHAQREGGEALRKALLRATATPKGGKLTPEHITLLEDMTQWYCGYLQHDGPWDFGDEQFVQRGLDLLGRFFRRRLMFSAPVNTWITRQLLGLRALAFRLGARVNMKRLDEAEAHGVWERQDIGSS